MAGFVLFGHSFVKRLKNKHGCIYDVQLQRSKCSITCLGEGSLTVTRIQKNPSRYFQQLRELHPTVLIIDLGTNDLCSAEVTPHQVHASLCEMVRDLRIWDVYPEAVVFLPVLPRTGGLRGYQVSLEVFNKRVLDFNMLLESSTFLEDRWWVWHHRGIKHPRLNLDGVHLNKQGMLLYERTLRQLLKFFEFRIW